MSDKIKKKRERLWWKNPNCHWCGRWTIPPGICPKRFKGRRATVDHVVDRNDPSKPYEKHNIVLACWRCNQRRSNESVKQLPKEEVWRRSGAYPRGHPLAKDRNANREETTNAIHRAG